MPLFFIYMGLRKAKVSRMQTTIICFALIATYMFGPIRQAMSNALILYALFCQNSRRPIYFLLALFSHWSAILPISMILIFSNNIHNKIKIFSFCALLTYSLIIHKELIESKIIQFSSYEDSYFSPISLVFKLTVFSIYLMLYKNKVLARENWCLSFGCLCSCLILFPYGLGANTVQRIGMMLDPFFYLTIIKILSNSKIAGYGAALLTIDLLLILKGVLNINSLTILE